MTDSAPMSSLLAPIPTLLPDGPVDRDAAVGRFWLTLVGAGQALLGLPKGLAIAILWLVALPLTLALVGVLLALVAVPAGRALADAHRRFAGALLGERIEERLPPRRGPEHHRPATNLARRPARWRDFAHLWFSATGGFVLSALPALLVTAPVVHVTIFGLDPDVGWVFLLFLSGPMLLAWWLVTPSLLRGRALADRGILGHSRIARARGAGRRCRGDPDRVTRPPGRRDPADRARPPRRCPGPDRSGRHERRARREADRHRSGLGVRTAPGGPRDDPVGARGPPVRRTRNPPAGPRGPWSRRSRRGAGVSYPDPGDRRRVGADAAAPGRVGCLLRGLAECLANVVKHAEATRAWVTAQHDGDRLQLVVGDDGRGGAAAEGGGLSGVARRLAAFDGTMTVDSPEGGPTVVRTGVPCPAA